MNLCQCGHYGNPNNTCRCTPHNIRCYQQKISGPLLERIDLHITMLPLDLSKFATQNTIPTATNETLKKHVIKARQRQEKRKYGTNAQLSKQAIQHTCRLDPEDEIFFIKATQKLNLSARTYHRTLRVARTIADLQNSNTLKKPHLMEALSYQVLPTQPNDGGGIY